MWAAAAKDMLTIRPAWPQEAEILMALCIRSKAHWGYDAEFMQQAAAALTITQSMVEKGGFLVAESETGGILGVAAINPLAQPGKFDLAFLFVEPAAIRTGIGRALFGAAAQLAAQNGGTSLSILADPFAEAFYERLGAKRIGEAPSDAIPGRSLPLLEYAIPDAPIRAATLRGSSR